MDFKYFATNKKEIAEIKKYRLVETDGCLAIPCIPMLNLTQSQHTWRQKGISGVAIFSEEGTSEFLDLNNKKQKNYLQKLRNHDKNSPNSLKMW